MDVNQAVVIDNGSGIIKAGFAGDVQPKCCIPAYVGRPKHRTVMASAHLEGDSFVGSKAQEYRGLMKLRYPIEHGIVEHWDDMELIWDHVYKEELKTPSEEHPLLLTEAPLNPKRNREQAARILFETLNVPALYLSVQAVLSLYASGRTTGAVLDVGDGVTHAVPVYEGFAITQAIRRVDVAGRDVTRYLQTLLRKAGYPLTTSAELEIVREIKERICKVAPNLVKTTRETAGRTEEFILPDGVRVNLGPERFQAPEVLFDPSIIGDESPGVHAVINDAVRKTDIDLRRTLYSNIVLSGGSTLFEGFGERLLADVKSLAPKDIKIKIYAPPERKLSTWSGGAILAGLSTFKRIWVSAAEYAEDPDIIHKKLA